LHFSIFYPDEKLIKKERRKLLVNKIFRFIAVVFFMVLHIPKRFKIFLKSRDIYQLLDKDVRNPIKFQDSIIFELLHDEVEYEITLTKTMSSYIKRRSTECATTDTKFILFLIAQNWSSEFKAFVTTYEKFKYLQRQEGEGIEYAFNSQVYVKLTKPIKILLDLKPNKFKRVTDIIIKEFKDLNVEKVKVATGDFTQILVNEHIKTLLDEHSKTYYNISITTFLSHLLSERL
jgi:hypothetical protein